MACRGQNAAKEDAMLKRIAVPLDGSALGEFALPYAIAVARSAEASLTLLHVHRPFLPGRFLEALPQFRFQDVAGYDDVADRAAFLAEQDRFGVLADQLRSAYGLQVSTQVLHGDVPNALAEYARASGTDLMVMATHGYAGAWSTWLDSTSDAVVRNSSVPVLLVCPAPDEAPPHPGSIDFRRILVPLDGSGFSEAILDPAVELTRKLGLRVTLLRVAPEEAERLPSPVRQGGVEPGAYLESVSERFPGTVPPPVTRVRFGDAGEEILEELAEGRYDMIAMATHGRGGVRHILFGSTTDQVMRHATTPVLLLRPAGLGSGVESIVAGAAAER
jgi:nucleotide-binding universal stress UspA family protein